MKIIRVATTRNLERNNAEAHLKVLQHMTPQDRYTIIFEITPDAANPSIQSLERTTWL